MPDRRLSRRVGGIPRACEFFSGVRPDSFPTQRRIRLVSGAPEPRGCPERLQGRRHLPWPKRRVAPYVLVLLVLLTVDASAVRSTCRSAPSRASDPLTMPRFH